MIRRRRIGFILPRQSSAVTAAYGSIADIDTHAQSSRLAEFGSRGMSFNICRGTLGSLAMFTAIRNASSRVSLFIDNRRCDSSRPSR
jgi:hypothetical protein